MDIEQWLSEIASEPPCGPDLEYDSEFLSFDQLARGKPEQQYGDTVIAAEEPDWRAVDRAAASLFQRSKDFRVACVLARAWTRMHGMTGFADGLALNLGLLERYWDTVHPRLDIDGEYDPVPRSNALNILGNADGLMRDFRAAALLQGVGAPILVRDAETIQASGADSAVMSRSQLTAMLVNAHTAGSPELQALLRAQQSLGTIRQICLDKLGPESSPDLADLSALVSQLLHPITSQQGAAEAGEEATAEPQLAMGAAATGGAAAPLQIAGEIRSREDAIRVMGLVCSYLERYEPTSPAPLLIRRAQRMMTMDFMAIINELAPDSLNQVKLVTGSNQES